MAAKKKAAKKSTAKKKAAKSKSERGDIATRFQPGNKFWEARSSHGRKPKFKKPEDLQDGCNQYFDWNHENPLIAIELVKFQGTATQAEVPKLRAMSVIGLCQFLDIETRTWRNFKKERPDLLPVCEWAEDIIFRQKVEGASADLLNASIIARDLGLADKKDVSHSGLAVSVYLPDNKRDSES